MLRKVEADQDDTIIKEEDPGKFKDESTYPKWEVKFENYLSTISGVNIVSLSYVVRSHAYPDRTTDFQGDFIAETIIFTTLSGAHFYADARKVHQPLKINLVNDTAKRWISSIEKRTNGRDNFNALRCHYRDEVNVRRRITTEDHLQ